jgi:hypothetical protein
MPTTIRRDPWRRTKVRAGRRTLRPDVLGETEVEELDVSLWRHFHVGGFQVAVKDPLGVRAVQRVGHIVREDKGARERERAPVQQLPDRLARH